MVTVVKMRGKRKGIRIQTRGAGSTGGLRGRGTGRGGMQQVPRKDAGDHRERITEEELQMED